MFRLSQSTNRFEIYYQNILVYSHRNDNPSLILAVGKAVAKEDEGYYTFKDKILTEHKMDRFKVDINREEAVLITFSSSQTYKSATMEFIPGIDLQIHIRTDILDINRVWVQFPSHIDENVYGCGEQFSYFCLNGMKVPLWVQEQGVGRSGINKKLAQFIAGKGGSEYHTYYPQPTFIGLAHDVNYYCHSDSSVYAEFEFHKKGPAALYHELLFWGIPNTISIGIAPTPLELVGRLTQKLGIQPALPEWVYDGMWVAIQGHGGLEHVKARLKKFLDADVKISAIWSQDWEGIRTTSFGTRLFWDWKWNGQGREIRFPNFPEIVKEVREQYNIRYLGYINCFLSLVGDLYEEVPDKSYFVQKKNGTQYVMDVSENNVVMFDLTNPACFEWVKSIIKKYMIQEAGLSGWMSDYGEYLPLDAKLYSGEDPWKAHNLYPVLFAKANIEAIQELGLEKEVTFFSRAGYTGTSKYSPNIWAGDQNVSWERHDGLYTVIPAALSLGMCGIGQHHSDIGGFTTVAWVKRTKELLLRWTEQCAFTPVMRSHEGNRPEENWQLDSDDETLFHLARMTQIHVALKPYFIQLSKEYQEQGIPFIRAPVLYYPEDPKMIKMETQYLLGADLWVAPVIKAKVSVKTIYFPSNGWIHLWTGTELTQGNIKIDVPYGYPAVFYRKGSDFQTLFESIGKQFGFHGK